MIEFKKMIDGKIYNPTDPYLLKLRKKCHALCLKYNRTSENNSYKRKKILTALGLKMGENVYLQGPIYFDYGCNISIGDNSYANFNLTILDTCQVSIGKNVFIGTGVSIVTPLHPLRYQERNQYLHEHGYMSDKEYGKPIVIEDNCWIATNVTILPGVTIGEGCVIGAGSVVSKSIPKNSLAFGNPIKVVKEINDRDMIDKSLL